MSDRVVIIKVENSKISFSPTFFLNIEETNIPDKYLKFRTNKDIFWEVEMTSYMPDSKSLTVLVKDYNSNEKKRFEGQLQKRLLNRLIFEKLDWLKLEPLLTSYVEGRLKEFAYNFKEPELSNSNYRFSRRGQISPNSQALSFQNTHTTSSFPPKMTTKEFWVSFDDAKFETGYISFEKKIEEINESQVFKIFNEYVLPEFENIKNWFVRKLRTKRFRVIAKINFGFNDPPEIEATSVQIAQISPELIDSIKYDRTDQLTKELGDVNSEKSSFTADEMFTFLSDESEGGNIFNQSEEDILNYFIGIKNVRNKKQLAYLSDKKQSVNYRLRYTLRPTFGFLFFVEGSTKEHFVWEMLDSNATYVWSINKGQYEAHFDIIDKILSRIKSKGRNGYKQEYQKEKRRDDFIFDIIRHDHIATQETDGYLIWKNKIDNLLN